MNGLLAIALLSPPLQYPLDYTPKVSAAFGTYRIGHHHAGLDLYSDDDDTIPVRAAADGWVVRIRRSHNGYGRAVYVNHDDGRQTVYGHLSAFGPALDPAVEVAKETAKGYRFDHRPDRGIPVKQGDLLGWVGTAGTDLVHLHFELRHRGPVNPLMNGLKIPDDTPPRIKRLLVVPATPDAHVHDTHDERFFELAEDTPPIEVGGDVVLYAQITDIIDGTRELIAAEVEFLIDGAPWHQVVYDRVRYGDKAQTELDYHPRLRATGEGVFNRLRKAYAPVRVQRKAGAPLTGLDPGDHEAEIIAKDAAGNTSRVKFTLRVRARNPLSLKFAPLPDGELVEGPHATLRGTLLVQPLPLGATEVAVRRAGEVVPATLTRHNDAHAVAFSVSRRKTQVTRVGYRIGDGPPQWIPIRTVALERDKEVWVGEIGIKADKKSMFVPYPTLLQKLPSPTIDGVEVLSPLYRLANGWHPTKGGKTLKVPWPPGVPGGGVGVYVLEGKKRWRVGTRREGDHIICRTVHLGDFVVLRDTEPPVISPPTVKPHPAGPQLIVPVEDKLSGLRSVTLKVDGVPVEYEHQRAMRRLVWRPLPPGPHVIEVSAKDREGHAIKQTFNLTPLPKAAPREPTW